MTSNLLMPITNDADFLRLHAAGTIYSGITFYQSGPSRPSLLGALLIMAGRLSAEEMQNHVEYL